MKIILAEIERPCGQASFLKTALSRAFNAEVEVLKRPLRADYAHFHTARGQWDAALLLGWLAELFSKHRGVLVVGLFPYDIFAAGRRRVFGVAENNGRTALVSYHSMDPSLHGKPDEELLRRRLFKKCVHEIGHLLGLDHCARRSCVMNQARNLMFLDRKSAGFCPRCRSMLLI